MKEVVVVTVGATSRAKLQSNRHHQQTNTQFFTGRMPFMSPNQQYQSTEGKISHSMDLLTPSSPGVFQLLSLTTNSSWCYLGEGCHASHQPSDASTPNTIVTVKYFLKAYLKLHIVQKANCLVMNNTSSYQQCCMMHNHGFLLHIRLSLR